MIFNLKVQKKRSSFSFRLSLKFTMIVTLAIVVSMTVMFMFVNHLVRSEQGDELIKSTEDINRVIRNWTDFSSEPYFYLPYYVTYSVTDERLNHVVFTNDPFLPAGLKKSSRPRIYFERNYFSDGNLNILYYKKTFAYENLRPYEDGKPAVFTIVTAINIDSDYFSQLAKIIPVIFIPVLFFVLLLSFLLSFLITRNTIRPVVRITREVSDKTVEILDKVLPLSGNNDEIDELAKVFNSLFARLKSDFEREKQFSSDVSHELKTPLTVISGHSDLLLRWGREDPAQLETSLKAIKAEAKSMQSIIETLLQISRYESGRVKPVLEIFYLEDLFTRIKKEFEHIEGDKEVQIESYVEDDLFINSDEEMLHQILLVFISNSIKFCREKTCLIKLEAVIKKSSDSEGWEEILISESDNGPGISEKDLPNIFDRFYMGDQARTRTARKNSTGLGLSIAKTLCSSLEGKITAGNAENGGALFTIELPKK